MASCEKIRPVKDVIVMFCSKFQCLLFILPLVIIANFCKNSLAFNIDVNSRVIIRPPSASCPSLTGCLFGFSVAQHREQNTSWLLIGSPTAESGQPGVTKGGAVFKCSINPRDECQQIPFDTTGNTFAPHGRQYDQKSGQWFGALVRSSGENGVVLACAPRYTYYIFKKRDDPFGACYTSRRNFTETNIHRPCLGSGKWGHHRQGSCQAGLGGDITKNGDMIFVGAVGSFYWQGQVFAKELNKHQNLDQLKTGEGLPGQDDSYLGYSVAVGEFSGDGDRKDVVVGMPRGAKLAGKVVLYNSKLINLFNITGNQVGAYFGYDVASCDVNGDGLDDVIIGAPMWSNYESTASKFEMGRVYVFYQDQRHKFRQFDILDGVNHKSRFGTSVTCAGNINLDGRSNKNHQGIQDLIVGAPYDGPDNRGAIYVFLGSKEGISKTQSQIIWAREIDPLLKGFGWSLSAGMDMDHNKYPDVLVGAYESGHAVHLSTAPVLHLDAKVNFLSRSKNINIDHKGCTLRDRKTRVPCIEVSATLKYEGIGVPHKIELEVQYILDVKVKKKRMFFMGDEGISKRNQTITIFKGRLWKDNFKVYLPTSNIRDKLTSLDIQVHYSIPRSRSRSLRQAKLVPVLGHHDRMAEDTISIQKNCGADNICIPNLSITTDQIGTYIVGSGQKIEISTRITNNGEDAFNTMLYLQIPRGIDYIKANSSADSMLCSPPDGANNWTLQCEVGNPMLARSVADLRIFLKPSNEDQTNLLTEYSFALAINSSNPEVTDTRQDNQKLLFIPIEVNADFRVTGTSKPDQVKYNSTALLPDEYVTEDDIGEEIIHNYNVKNRGPSTIEEAEVVILWPSFYAEREHLLYLLGIDYDSNIVQCQTIRNINPMYIKTKDSRGFDAGTVLSAWKTTQQRYDTRKRGGYKEGIKYHEYDKKISSARQNERFDTVGHNNGHTRTYGEIRSRTQSHVDAFGAGKTRLTNSNREFDTGSIASSNENLHLDARGRYSSSMGNYKSPTSNHDLNSWKRYDNGTYIRTYEDQTEARSKQNWAGKGQNQFSPDFHRTGETVNNEYDTLGSNNFNIGSSVNTHNYNPGVSKIFDAARGPGNYHGTIGKAELEKESGGPIFRSRNPETLEQIRKTSYHGHNFEESLDGHSSFKPYLQEKTFNNSNNNIGLSYHEGSYFNSDSHKNRGGGRWNTNHHVVSTGSNLDRSLNTGRSSFNQGGSIRASSHALNSKVPMGKWVYSNDKDSWEWKSLDNVLSQTTSDSAPISKSNHNQSHWSSWSTSQTTFSHRTKGVQPNSIYGPAVNDITKFPNSYTVDNSRQLYNSGGDEDSVSRTRSRVSSETKRRTYSTIGELDGRRDFDPHLDHTGEKNYFTQTPDAHGNHRSSGQEDTGWVLNSDNTWTRRTSSWSSEEKQINREKIPSNIEPGFQDQYLKSKNLGRRKRRSKRNSSYKEDFDAEIEGCDPQRCTLIRCTVGPLKKGQSALFKVRSRLFTETLVKNYAQPVQISSKLVTRIVRLPFQASVINIPFQTYQVTTEVFPTELNEEAIPWWIWLLASLGGMITLCLISYLLYKCGFFKRKRPEEKSAPENEPLNGNGYNR